MSSTAPNARLVEELRGMLDRGLASGTLMSPDQMERSLVVFRDRFGPTALGGLDGDALLRRMHGRQGEDLNASLAYWLEYKDDDEFRGREFGSIAGGSVAKFGVYQRQGVEAWMIGKPTGDNVVPHPDAVAKARLQRDELLAGHAALGALDPQDTSDQAYAALQARMKEAAPELHASGWAHKWWFLLHPDLLDGFHTPRYQRFHLIKLLQAPPQDGSALRDANAPRFTCAGRFVALAHELGASAATLTSVLNQRHGAFHRYWRVGTRAGDNGGSQWEVMRDGGFVSIGWKGDVLDLSERLGSPAKDLKEQVRHWLDQSGAYSNPASATRKAGEITDFTLNMKDGDIVLASDGQTVLGIGRVKGDYRYDESLVFPHLRPAEWLSLKQQKLPEPEGLRTSCFEVGKSLANLLAVEERLFEAASSPPPLGVGVPKAAGPTLPALEPMVARIEQVLRRKGQVLLYGPPGTGKTHWALRAARELASRRAFGNAHSGLDAAERAQLDGPSGLVRICTFHPGYGYEDFMEGLRPQVADAGHLVFAPRDGLFKRLCQDAGKLPDRDFFVVIDEFNRGDVPRIFGELLTVIEYDKRDTAVLMPVTAESFTVPPNVYLIGTMNTADRSITLLDAALRRRFGFIELMPDSTALGSRSIDGLALGPWLDALNARVRAHLKRDARNLQIGHAYLLPATSLTEFARVLRHDLVPLLEEYCYEDFATLEAILGKALVDAKAARVRDEVFEMPGSGKMTEILRFPEMESFVQAVGIVVPDEGEDDAENAGDDPIV